VAQTAPSPAPATAAVPATSIDELKKRLEQVAERSPRDRAMLDQLEIVDFTGDAARVVLVDNGSGRYLATNPDPIRAMLSRAAGRPLRVTLDTSRLRSESDAPRPVQVDDPSVRNDPLVRRAAELFDASVIAVTPRFSPGSDPSGGASMDESSQSDQGLSSDPLVSESLSIDTTEEP
jgi:hypothetical protein